MRLISTIILMAVIAASAPAYFNSPESILWEPASQSYLISNAGDGSIVRMTESDTTWFSTGLGSIRGICLGDGKLFAACNGGLARFDLATAELETTQPLPGQMFPNDVVRGPDGSIFVSDTQAGKVFRVDPATMSVTTFVNSGLSSPNGLIYDYRHDRLLVCSFRANSPIQIISLQDSSVSILHNTTLDNLDGLAMDNYQGYYVSSWGTNAIYRFDTGGVDTEPFAEGFSGPADISTAGGNVLLVPNFNSNSVSIGPALPEIVKQGTLPRNMQLRNDPNPFNPNTTIEFTMASPARVRLRVFNLLGEEIARPVEHVLDRGVHRIPFAGGDLSSGLYLYSLETLLTEVPAVTGQMLLIR